MKNKLINIFWGAALIILGGLFLAQQMDWIDQIAPIVWTVFFALLSIAFFASYFLSGRVDWGWLFPAFIFGGLAITTVFAAAGVGASWIGAPILGGIAAPFFIVYAMDRPKNWWALIPGLIMGGIAVVLLLTDFVPSEVIGTFVLYMIALPFFIVYLTDRKRWWALIPAGVMAVIGLIPLLSMLIVEEILGASIMFLFAIPFLVVYFWSKQNWWALIPAGVFASIGVVVVLVEGLSFVPSQGGIIAGVLFAGWALTFLTLWFRRGSAPTAWAIYPAGALAIVAVASIAYGGEAVNVVWPVLLILAGLLVLFTTMRRKAV